MGKDSKIGWTHHTFNPWWGCTKVAAGCANCYDEESPYWTRGPDWIIVGAESGPSRRPFKVEWAESIYGECEEFGIPFFGKQDSGLHPGALLFFGGHEVKEFPTP